MKQKMRWHIRILLAIILLALAGDSFSFEKKYVGIQNEPMKTTTVRFFFKGNIVDSLNINVEMQKDGYSIENRVFTVVVTPNKTARLELPFINGIVRLSIYGRNENIFGSGVSYYLTSGDNVNFVIRQEGAHLVAKAEGPEAKVLTFFQEIKKAVVIPDSIKVGFSDPNKSNRLISAFKFITLSFNHRISLIEMHKLLLLQIGGQNFYEHMKAEGIAWFLLESSNLLDDLIKLNTGAAKNYLEEVEVSFRKHLVRSYTYSYVFACSRLAGTRALLANVQSRLSQSIQDYHGTLRDKVLVYHCLYAVNNDPEQYKKEIQQALNVIQDKNDRVYLENECVKKTAGEPFYPFELTNEEGKIVRLKDFIGKVLLIEVWYTGCSPCAQLARQLHEKVMPRFKGNEGVVFLSISLDKKNDHWKESIQRGIYTTTTSVNLYTNGLGWEHSFIKYYDINGAPQLILVNKAGKILSFNARPNGMEGFEKLNQQIHDAIDVK